jgi:hypothetical protein
VSNQDSTGAGQIPTKALIQSFFDEATSVFLVLAEGRVVTELKEARAGAIQDATLDTLEGFFLARCSFTTYKLRGEISFGDREYDVTVLAGPLDEEPKYQLWEWALACGKPDLLPTPTTFVFQTDRLKQIVQETGRAVAALEQDIAKADPAVLQSMDRKRQERQDAFSASMRDDDHRLAVARAADAFRSGNYSAVVALLEPLSDLLTGAELKKLQYARRQLAG